MTMTVRVWVLALVLFTGGCQAAPRLRCAVRPSARAVSASRARGFSNVAAFSEACSSADVTSSSARASASASASAGGRSVGVSAVSSTGDREFRPFRVIGGEAVDTKVREETVVIVETGGRPAGPWYFVVEANIAVSVHEAWITMRNFGNVLLYGLEGFHKNVRSLDPKGKKWAVDLKSDERIVFEVEETDGQEFYHLVTIESHTPLVFPGVNVRGSSMFVQFISKDDGSTLVQLGWGGRVNGPKDVALIAVGGLGQELLDNLEEHFGELCNDDKSIRTIEGDCNNLNDPRRAAAGHALVRLGGGDPSFPGNNPTIPSGPGHISPRLISNRLCATSPGQEILESNARFLRGRCYQTTEEGNLWKICPFREASVRSPHRRGHRLQWDGLISYDDGSIGLKFSGPECDLELAVACHGSSSVVLVDDPCGKPGNRLFHPVACRIRPGEDEVLENSNGLTDLFWTFGQFVDHDMDLTPVTAVAKKKQPGFSRLSRSGNKDFPVPVPRHDFFIKEREMEFERTTLLKDRSRGLHENQHSAFADLGQVYGVDYLRARALRSFSGGKLKVQARNLPPFNKISGFGALRAKVDNAPDEDEKLFVVGDVRGNEQTLLLAMHIIWLREHNRVCDELYDRFPRWSDERIYQTARAIVIAEYQSILYTEWLPLLLGQGAVPAEAYAYDVNVDASITAIFSTSAFRIGHTMVGSHLLKLGPGPKRSARLERVPLRRAFFKPELVIREGIDSFVRGAAWHLCKEIDIKVVDEIRNFLFTEDENKGHLDLVSLNIQRGRDMGLPSFNQMRALFGLPKYESFYDFIEDPHIAAAADRVYEGDIDQCDSFIGGIAEKTFPGSLLGESFHVIIRDQFTKVRDGDRFFYRGLDWDRKILKAYPRLNDIITDKVKLKDILVRNTHIRYEELGHRGSDTVFKI